jgi:hypothetical protein
VLPATHWASANRDPYLPRMGERIRLRRDFEISGFPPHAQAILRGLKKYLRSPEIDRELRWATFA